MQRKEKIREKKKRTGQAKCREKIILKESRSLTETTAREKETPVNTLRKHVIHV